MVDCRGWMSDGGAVAVTSLHILIPPKSINQSINAFISGRKDPHKTGTHTRTSTQNSRPIEQFNSKLSFP